MTKFILSGSNGRMGQAITRLVANKGESVIVAGVDLFDGIKNSYPVYSKISDVVEKADVIIDFSNPESIDSILEYATNKKLPVVISTTGHSPAQKLLVKEASKSTAIFMSGNMSLGINLLMDLISQAAKTLEGNCDIEIIEKHHNKKIDAPSGTALMLANAVNDALENKCDYVYERESKREKRSNTEIGIHSIRGGTIVGEHSVLFIGQDEEIEIKHTATSREVFAVGAIKAAQFMVGKSSGNYSMKDVIEQG